MPRNLFTVSFVALRIGRTSFCSRLIRLASWTMRTISATPMTSDFERHHNDEDVADLVGGGGRLEKEIDRHSEQCQKDDRADDDSGHGALHLLFLFASVRPTRQAQGSGCFRFQLRCCHDFIIA